MTWQKCSPNTEAIETLSGHIARLNIARDLQAVSDEAKDAQSQWLLVRMAKASELEGQIEDCVKTVSWLIQCLIIEGTIAVELAVHLRRDIAEDARQGFMKVTGRLDEVDEELDGVRQDISQLGTNAIPGLRYAPNARFDYARSGRSECDPETRREVLASIWPWLLPDNPRLKALPDLLFTVPPEYSTLWVKAMAGAGKSTVAQTIVDWSAEAKMSASLRSLVRLILGTVALAEEPLSPAGLEGLLHLQPGTARGTLNKLQSIFLVPSVEEEPTPARPTNRNRGVRFRN
ncbi:hypothetical protein NUW54_g5278 [Trametes sanguinea]|uniref:Uncharacterized protein n=1 Tax=Trametes sanguinea TaxID=158606 RepID=A0ACC1PXE3_9APHY|nr:hypothetical protein NUW54_g5278 [Trametes sanguinea]